MSHEQINSQTPDHESGPLSKDLSSIPLHEIMNPLDENSLQPSSEPRFQQEEKEQLNYLVPIGDRLKICRGLGDMVTVNDLYSTRYFDSKGEKNSGHLGKNDKPEIDIPMLFPLKEYTSERGHVKQSLMAIIQVNKYVALGVVKGKDEQGSEAVYLSLMTDEVREIITSGRMARAKLVQVLRENSPTTIGRQQIDKASGLEGTEATHSGVSATHFTIKLHDGKLSIRDENSLNGTSVFHNNEELGYNIFKIEHWSISGEDTKKLIDAENESKIRS